MKGDIFMIKPKKLNRGDKVAIVSLSRGILGMPFAKHENNAFAFHPEGKYITLLTNQNTIKFVNLTNVQDNSFLMEPDALNQSGYLRYVRDGKQNIYLTYPTGDALKYKMISGLSPNYTRMLREELLAKMDDWSKMRDGETMEEYKQRVNEDTRMRQAQLFEQEIATRMADDMVMNSNVTLGGYNPESNMLTLNFDNMPTVYLTVPEKEVQDFMTPENLEFRDAMYGLTKDDKFELINEEIKDIKESIETIEKVVQDTPTNDELDGVKKEIAELTERLTKVESRQTDVVEMIVGLQESIIAKAIEDVKKEILSPNTFEGTDGEISVKFEDGKMKIGFAESLLLGV